MDSGTFAFRITGSDGAPVTAFDVSHDKRMHLIVVRRDSAGFQHVHPEMAADGTWSVPLTVVCRWVVPGVRRLHPHQWPADHARRRPLRTRCVQPVTHAATRTAQVDGYTVEPRRRPRRRAPSPVTLAISRDGAPVTDLQPYLGAYGHLVALREGDLAYLHVHPAAARPRPGRGLVRRRGTQRRYVPAVPRLPGRRRRPHGRIHRPHRTWP